MLVYIDALQAELATLSNAVQAGQWPTLPPFAELATNQRDLDSWVSTPADDR